MTRLADWIVAWPKTIVLLVFLLTAVFGYHARHIGYDSSFESLLPHDDPHKAYYEEVRQLFGSDEFAVIGLITDDVYRPEVLQKIGRITEAVRSIPEVEIVRSLTNAEDLIKTIAEETTLLLPNIPPTPAEIESLKQKLTDQPQYLNNLVSPDGRAAAIAFAFSPMSIDTFIRRGVDNKIQAIVDREQGPEELYYAGLPHLKAYADKEIPRNVTTLVPLGLLLVMGILYASFGSLRGVLLPALSVLVSLTWTLGLMVLAGSRLSIGMIAMPLLILALGVAYSLHVIAAYYELVQPDRQVQDVVQETVQTSSTPILLAALTTALGFLSLLVSPSASVQAMGLYSAVGIVFAFLLAVVLVPALLALLRLPPRHEETYAPVLNSALQKLVRAVLHHRGIVLIISGIIVFLSFWPIPSLQVGTNLLTVFPKGHPIRQAEEKLAQHLAGSLLFYVVVDGASEGIMRKWDTVRRLKELQAYIDSLPGIDKTISFVDACEISDKAIQTLPPIEGDGEGEPSESPQSFWDNPDQLDGAIQLLAGMAPNILSRFVDYPHYSRVNIRVRTSLSSPSEIEATVQEIEAYAQEHFPSELRVRPTGDLILETRSTGNLIRGQIQSLTLTAVVIFGLLALMFLSVRIGVLAMIPNLFPIVVFFGLMGVSGAVLSASTSTIAAIVLGLAVDDTIHLMTQLSRQVRTSADEEHVLLKTFSTIGKPVFYTSLITLSGFLTLCLSSFAPVQEFGWLSATTILVVFAGDVILLPALLASTRIITLWDLLYLKLGRDPHRTIPLFAGLRPFQAKIVTLMGKLQSYPHGQAIIRQGEMGKEMYVLVNGAAEVFIQANGRPQRIRTLSRGDVCGEMGLLRHQERTADVIATGDVEVLAVDEQFLTRLKRRYPRTAAEIFFNISKILSDRLETSEQMRQ